MRGREIKKRVENGVKAKTHRIGLAGSEIEKRNSQVGRGSKKDRVFLEVISSPGCHVYLIAS